MEPVDWAALSHKFFNELSSTGNVSAACRAVGVSRQSAYARRRADAAFSAEWDDCIETGIDALELEARRRAIDGCVRPVFYKGGECGEIREYSDTLMIVLLKAHRPQKFRDNVQHEHAGGLTIRVEYADSYDLANPSASRTGDDPAGLPAI